MEQRTQRLGNLPYPQEGGDLAVGNARPIIGSKTVLIEPQEVPALGAEYSGEGTLEDDTKGICGLQLVRCDQTREVHFLDAILSPPE